MVFQIAGTDISDYIAPGGLKWTRSDVDGTNAGRGLDGTLIRDRVAIKRRLDVTCHALSRSEAATVLALIEPEFVSVTYTDPMAGGAVAKTMYSNNFSLSLATFFDVNGIERWTGLSFPLIER